jgi:hypothetical protein
MGRAIGAVPAHVDQHDAQMLQFHYGAAVAVDL